MKIFIVTIAVLTLVSFFAIKLENIQKGNLFATFILFALVLISGFAGLDRNFIQGLGLCSIAILWLISKNKIYQWEKFDKEYQEREIINLRNRSEQAKDIDYEQSRRIEEVALGKEEEIWYKKSTVLALSYQANHIALMTAIIKLIFLAFL